MAEPGWVGVHCSCGMHRTGCLQRRWRFVVRNGTGIEWSEWAGNGIANGRNDHRDRSCSPIKGASVTVPPGAVASGNVNISITYQDAPPGPLPPEAVAAGATFVSKTIVLTKDRPGTFDLPLTVTVPYQSNSLAADDIPLVLYWNEGTNSYSVAKLINFDSALGQVTFETAHFSSFFVTAIRDLKKLLATCPSCDLSMPSFKPSVDGFSLANFGSYSSPKANCLGMASFADWYFEQAKAREGISLFNRFPLSSLIATELIVRAQAMTTEWVSQLGLSGNLLSPNLMDRTMGLAMVEALLTTKQPILFTVAYTSPLPLITAEGWQHELIVYGYKPMSPTSGIFQVYNPNDPGNDNLEINFDINTGFSGFGFLTFNPPPNTFYFDSAHSAYSPEDMEGLLNGAKAGWDAGQFGKINITNQTFAPDNYTIRLWSPDNVLLKGTVESSGGSQDYVPDHVEVYIRQSLGALTKVGDVEIDATSLKFEVDSNKIPLKLQNGANEIVLIACRNSSENVGTKDCGYYGTFRMFQIFIGRCPPTPTIVKDINPGAGGTFATSGNQLVNVNGTLFFSAYTPTYGTELWKSDGTEAGTVLVKDIGPGATTMNFAYLTPQFLTNVQGTLFFIMDDGQSGLELWKSDGTEAGTIRVQDINPGAAGAFYWGLSDKHAAAGKYFYFTATDGTNGVQLWRSDGTLDEAKVVSPPGVINFDSLTDVNGTLYFSASTTANGYELWKIGENDSVASVAVAVNEVGTLKVSSPTGLTNVNGTLYFSGLGEDGQRELWKYNGTATLVKDLNGTGNGSPTWLTNVNGILFFMAFDTGIGDELFKSDGTPGGTGLVKDMNPMPGLGSSNTFLTKVGNKLFFRSGESGLYTLWVSDGTAAGTTDLGIMVTDPANGSPEITDVMGKAFFRVGTSNLGKSDGTLAGTSVIMSNSSPQSLRDVNGVLFLLATTPDYGMELWSVCGVS